jgi:hypothetical protein
MLKVEETATLNAPAEAVWDVLESSEGWMIGIPRQLPAQRLKKAAT